MQPPIYPTIGLSPHLYSRLHAAPHLPHHRSLTSPILKTTCSPPPIYPTIGPSPHLYSRLHAAPHLPHHRSLTSPILKTTCSPPPIYPTIGLSGHQHPSPYTQDSSPPSNSMHIGPSALLHLSPHAAPPPFTRPQVPGLTYTPTSHSPTTGSSPHPYTYTLAPRVTNLLCRHTANLPLCDSQLWPLSHHTVVRPPHFQFSPGNCSFFGVARA